MELHNLSAEESLQNKHVRHFLAANGIGLDSSMKVRAHISWRQRHLHRLTHQAEVLVLLPDRLTHQLLVEIRAPTVLHFAVCEYCYENFGGVFTTICRDLCNFEAGPDNEIFCTGAPCRNMYFVAAGKLPYTACSIQDAPTESSGFDDFTSSCAAVGFKHCLYEQRTVLIKEGSYLSEAVLWVTWRHRGLLQTVKNVSLLTLDTFRFHETCVHSSSLAFALKRYATKFARVVSVYYQDLSDHITQDRLIDLFFNH